MKQAIFIRLIIFTICLASNGIISYGQLSYSMTTLSDGNGNPIMMKKATETTSNHLFNPNYIGGVIYLKGSDKPIAGNKFKLDLQENKLFFLDSIGSEMEVTSPVMRVEFIGGKNASGVFEKGFPPIGKLTSDNFYQVLVNGKAILLADIKFEEVSYKEYNSALTTTRTDKLVSYYGAMGDKIVRITKPEDILFLTGDKTKQVSDYILKENIKIKKQADLEKVFQYYNSISK